MSDKLLTKLQGSDLALGIQFSATIGKEKALVLTAGVPLDMSYQGLDKILDNIARAVNRQELIYKHTELEEFIEKCEGDLEKNRAQERIYRSTAEATWASNGRKGQYSPQGKQINELQNYANTEQHLITQIRRLREQAQEMATKIKQVSS